MNPALENCKTQIENLIKLQGWQYRVLGDYIETMPDRLLDKSRKDESLTHNELLVLHILFKGLNPVYKTVILPGNGSTQHQKIRARLSDKLIQIPGAKTPQGSKYLVHFIIPIDCADLKNSFNEVIRIVNAI